MHLKVALEGSDQSWHIVNAPHELAVAGSPIPRNTHIDGGEDAVFQTRGIPPLTAGGSIVLFLTAQTPNYAVILYKFIFFCRDRLAHFN